MFCSLKHLNLIHTTYSSAPAAPEPIATANNEIKELDKEILVGAISIPTIHVNKTRDITLGFIKLKKD